MEKKTEKKALHLLIVTPLIPPESGGPSYYAVHLKAGIERLGHHVSLVAFREVRKYPTGIRHLLLLCKILRRARNADAVIALDTFSVALPSVLAARMVGRPVYLRTGGDFVWERYVERTRNLVRLSDFYAQKPSLSYKERLYMWIERHMVFPLATELIFSTEWQRAIWMSPYGLSERKTACIENAHTNVSTRSGNMGEREKRFVWIGRNLVLKNRAGLREAFKQVKEKHPDITLLELTDVPQGVAHDAIAKSVCLVVSSVSEVSPNSVMESVSLGTPAIAPYDTGVRDTFADVVYFVDTLDSSSLAQAMERMLDPRIHKEQCKKLLQFARVRDYDDVARDFMRRISGAQKQGRKV